MGSLGGHLRHSLQPPCAVQWTAVSPSLCAGGQLLNKRSVVLQATCSMREPPWQELPTYREGPLGQVAPVQETRGVTPRVAREQLRHLQRRQPRLDDWSMLLRRGGCSCCLPATFHVWPTRWVLPAFCCRGFCLLRNQSLCSLPPHHCGPPLGCLLQPCRCTGCRQHLLAPSLTACAPVFMVPSAD